MNHTRDSKFYYRDGSAVFLAENTLFRFQASLLDPDPGVRDYEFKDLMKYTLEGFEGGAGKPGASDAHPIILPVDITADQFRDFLMVVFGGVANDNFTTFLRGLQNLGTFNPLLLRRLIKLGHLGCRFGMRRLDNWSQTEICKVLQAFDVKHRVTNDWDAQVIVRFMQYMQCAIITHHRQKLFELMRLIISALVSKAYQLDEGAPQGNIISVCAALYREKDLLMTSPGFFGFIFAVIVSLGHQSPIWANFLTREDRRVLYAAHSTLTCLSTHTDLELGWVVDPAAVKNVCVKCSNDFDPYWNDTFSRCKGLKSRMPLEDIRHIVILPGYHVRFSKLLSGKARSCRCRFKMLESVEQRMETSYCNLTKKYKLLVETV